MASVFVTLAVDVVRDLNLECALLWSSKTHKLGMSIPAANSQQVVSECCLLRANRRPQRVKPKERNKGAAVSDNGVWCSCYGVCRLLLLLMQGLQVVMPERTFHLSHMSSGI